MDKITIFLSVSTLKIIVLTTTIGQFTTHSTHLSIKKHNVAECVSTSAKQCVPMNMIGGSQTHPQQHSVAALGFFLSTKWNLPF
ncbi:hypothetical protein SFRURICE_011146, partial [Spodoptera frugiperda]